MINLCQRVHDVNGNNPKRQL